MRQTDLFEYSAKTCSISLEHWELIFIHFQNQPFQNSLIDYIQGVFFHSYSGMDFEGPRRLLWVPKTGRKLLLGKKSTPMVNIISQKDCQKIHKMPRSVDLGIILMVSHGSSCFHHPLLRCFHFDPNLQGCSEQGV